MGDTQGLVMGAVLTAVALLSNSLQPLLVMGRVFLAESVSVIIQVRVRSHEGPRWCGPRVFRMALPTITSNWGAQRNNRWCGRSGW